MRSSFIFLHVFRQFSQHCLLKRLFFPLWVFLAHLNSVSWPYIPGFNSGLSMLFHWLVCLFLYQYHTVFFYSFVVYFEIWKHGTTVFVLFSQNCFWLFKIFCDCTHISGLFYFCEECLWYFDVDCWICLWLWVGWIVKQYFC